MDSHSNMVASSSAQGSLFLFHINICYLPILQETKPNFVHSFDLNRHQLYPSNLGSKVVNTSFNLPPSYFPLVSFSQTQPPLLTSHHSFFFDQSFPYSNRLVSPWIIRRHYINMYQQNQVDTHLKRSSASYCVSSYSISFLVIFLCTILAYV
ncbi:hypothetical protein B0H65DRAFT_232881 [Neurospora tetraspora]|uniref:Uncharacterized protein n=1 Tax=Neurospora tetraspora TaxID=94610 RepID=A0AAE0JDN9_9PEZI|nr:hypothetical protein B0H65DRAFT_232881 [Neurospora tetraspora]